MAKRRLDTLLVERGLAESREKARAKIMAGQVFVGEQPLHKAGVLVDQEAPLRLLASDRYVSRGGDKLEHALQAFNLDVTGAVAVDIGASTGGFTHCLLQHGAARVYAIDVGYGQLDYRLRQDPRVVVMERVNARYLASLPAGADRSADTRPRQGLPEAVDVATVDVSFISLEKVLPAVSQLLKSGGLIVALFKPQFQAQRHEVKPGGVIRDPLLQATLIGRFTAWAVDNGYRLLGLTRSPLLGPAGNVEFFFLLQPPNLQAPSS